MISEHDSAILTRDLPEHGLKLGDVGVVVSIHRPAGATAPLGYVLEIFALNGDTIDVVDVPADAVRAAEPTDRAAARPVAAE